MVQAVAGQDRPLVFQVGSELVVMDLIATDESGREVSDLTRSEIQIVEDGSPRPVQQLQLISRSVELHDRGLPAGTARAAPQPAAVAAAPGAGAGAASVIVAIDLNSMPPDAMPRVFAAILDSVNAAPPKTPTMIVALSEQLEVVQPFTTEVELLRQGLQRVAAASATQIDMAPLFQRLDRICGIAPPSDVVNTGIAAGLSPSAASSRSTTARGTIGRAASWIRTVTTPPIRPRASSPARTESCRVAPPVTSVTARPESALPAISSAPAGMHTTIGPTPAAAKASTECRTTGLPRHGANCLGMGCPARRPAPAATTIAAHPGGRAELSAMRSRA